MHDVIENAGADDSFLDRLKTSSDDTARHRVEVMRRVYEKHLKIGRDAELETEVKYLVEASAWAPEGRPAEGRALVVIGEAGVGKTWAIHRAVRRRPEFAPDGEFMPFVAFTAPNPCGLKQLGREFLRALGYEIERNLPEHLIWEKVRKHLRMRRVRFVWIDEMHHAVRSTELQRLRDTIKNVMQQKEWPVSFILAGLPQVAQFLTGDYQFLRRKRVVRFELLEFYQDAAMVRWALTEIVEKHATMTVPPDLASDEFIHRLCHAASMRFGIVIVLVRMAIERALDAVATDGAIRLDHFAQVYASLSGCEKSQNIFIAPTWHVIEPGNALLDLVSEVPPASEPPRSRRKK